MCAGYPRIKASLSSRRQHHHHQYIKRRFIDLTTSIKDEYPPLLNIKPTSSLLDLVQGLVIKLS
jgi:hypothetical protein